jgi:hypothetical protein
MPTDITALSFLSESLSSSDNDLVAYTSTISTCGAPSNNCLGIRKESGSDFSVKMVSSALKKSTVPKVLVPRKNMTYSGAY